MFLSYDDLGFNFPEAYQTKRPMTARIGILPRAPQSLCRDMPHPEPIPTEKAPAAIQPTISSKTARSSSKTRFDERSREHVHEHVARSIVIPVRRIPWWIDRLSVPKADPLTHRRSSFDLSCHDQACKAHSR